jgi:hypothetical protein
MYAYLFCPWAHRNNNIFVSTKEKKFKIKHIPVDSGKRGNYTTIDMIGHHPAVVP